MKRAEYAYRERLHKGARTDADGVTVYPPSCGYGGGKLADERLQRHYDTCSDAACSLCAGVRERELTATDEEEPTDADPA